MLLFDAQRSVMHLLTMCDPFFTFFPTQIPFQVQSKTGLPASVVFTPLFHKLNGCDLYGWPIKKHLKKCWLNLSGEPLLDQDFIHVNWWIIKVFEYHKYHKNALNPDKKVLVIITAQQQQGDKLTQIRNKS